MGTDGYEDEDGDEDGDRDGDEEGGKCCSYNYLITLPYVR